MRFSRKTVAPIAALGLSAALAACGGSHEKGGAEAAVPKVEAALGKAEARETASQVALYGTVEADKTAAVSARVMAAVTSVPVKAGDVVAKGQPLVEIDPQAARGQESQARGALAQAKAALALAERNYKRYQNLNKTGSASDLELDMARMQDEQAKGAVEQAAGAVAAASSIAGDSRVVAPFAGRVTRTLVDPGDLAAPGRPLVMLESGQGRRLVVSVPESLMATAGLVVGKSVPVSIDSLPQLKELKGIVAETSPGADPASHTFAVKIELSGALVPSGSTGRARVATGTRKAVVVPASAVLSQGGMSLVVVKDDQGKARSRAVTVGAPADGGLVEVLSGLAGGETVLLGLSSAPHDGAEVQGR